MASEMRKNVVISMIGTVLDLKKKRDRWSKWRPTVSLCQQEDFLVDRMEILGDLRRYGRGVQKVAEDIKQISPHTEVVLHDIHFEDPWDFEEVFAKMLDFCQDYFFDVDAENYFAHITTGTHVAQICWFLLAESRNLPGKLLQTSPPPRDAGTPVGDYTVIDLDLARYDRIAQRFTQRQADNLSFLKSGIATRNTRFNNLIEQLERIAVRSAAPVLLMGPTGAGKSQLAQRLYELKRERNTISGPFVEVNCATLRGEMAHSTLFGHVKGSFTGAMTSRPGLLKTADKGLLLLDEIGELGLDEQAMLLRALEEKRFLPLGADTEEQSAFQLICGTNRDLSQAVAEGKFREDLLARINLWTFQLPSLAERPEDIEPNLEYELLQHVVRTGQHVTMNAEARRRFLDFAVSPQAQWCGNFRDLNAAVTRMASLSEAGRITPAIVGEEIARLRQQWSLLDRRAMDYSDADGGVLGAVLPQDQLEALDDFDRVQLEHVIRTCRRSKSLSAAGRSLFAQSRIVKKASNDADRLRKYLNRFHLTWGDVTS